MKECSGSRAVDFSKEDKTILPEKCEEIKLTMQAENNKAAADKVVT